ncbi:MAG: CPBP family intramembrane glutamic endopeptidase [Opitutales bacterium]
MDPAADALSPVAGSLIAGILVMSLVLWFSPARVRASGVPLSPWRPSALDFGLFAWGVFIIFLFHGPVLGRIIGADNLRGEGTLGPVWPSILMGLLLQGLFISLFFAMRRLYPNAFGFALSSVKLGWIVAVRKAGFFFLTRLPIVWAISMVWIVVLQELREWGVPVEPRSQEIISVIIQAGGPLQWLLLTLMIVVAAPIGEELIFRGGFFRFFLGRMGRRHARVLSALVFASLHMSLTQLLPLAAVGYFMARAYEKTGSIKVPILFHAFFNLQSLLLLLAQQSG